MPNKFFPPQTDTDTRTNATPVAGEILFDTDENSLYVGDGQTPGGLPVSGGESGGVGTGIVEGRLTFPHTTTPSDPGAGNTAVYAKDDGKIYQLAAGGVEEEIGTGIIEGRLTFPHTTTPPDPGAGNTAVYAKDDGKIYQLAAGGVEEEIGTSIYSYSQLADVDTAGLVAGQTMFWTGAEWVPGNAVREVLTANRTYYVNTLTGNNNNSGLTPEDPLASATKASEIISNTLDCSIYDVTIIQEGDENNGVVLNSFVGSGTLTFQGVGSARVNATNPKNALTINGPGKFKVGGITLGSTANNLLYITNRADVSTSDTIIFQAGKFGIMCQNQSTFELRHNIRFSGTGWVYPIYCVFGDITLHTCDPGPGVITLTAGVSWTGYYFIYCERGFVRLYNTAYIGFSGSGAGGQARCSYMGKIIKGNVTLPGSGTFLQFGGEVYT